MTITVRSLAPGDAAATLGLPTAEDPSASRPDAAAVAAAIGGSVAGLAATAGGRLAGVLFFAVLPSIYTGRSWGHIEDLLTRDGDEGDAAAAALLDETIRRLEAAAVPDASIAVPTPGGRIGRLCRERGFGDEELLVLERLGPADPSHATPHAAIRAAVPGDAAAIANLVHVFAGEYGEPSGADAASVLGYLVQPRVGALLADAGGEPVGLLAHSVSFSVSRGRYAMIDDLVVHPDARRRGVAAALLASALAGFDASGITRSALWMQPDSVPAMRLYERSGFARTTSLLVRHGAAGRAGAIRQPAEGTHQPLGT